LLALTRALPPSHSTMPQRTPPTRTFVRTSIGQGRSAGNSD